jgi:hypothetical protein
VISARIVEAQGRGDAKTLRTLAAADERWILLERGAMFPGFMRQVPAVFSVKPADQPIRVIGFGDFGEGSAGQREVAATIVRVNAAARPFDFGITFGDNFYPSGMTSPTESRWVDWWEKLYGPLHLTFYPSLGNHEWYSDDGAVAEILHRSPTWFFPAPYYAFTAGPVEFFALDTTDLSAAQLMWLDRAIAASRSHWKVVYGHHPIFAPEAPPKNNSGALDYLATMQAKLWPLLRGRVDAYLCGHQHAMAHMAPREGVRFFMSGGGGASLSPVDRHAPGARFAASEFGFLTLEADAHRMSLAIFGAEGAPLDAETWTR